MLERVNIEYDFVEPSEARELIDFFEKYPHRLYDGIYGKYANGKDMPVFNTDENAESILWKYNHKQLEPRSEAVVWRENCESKDFGNDTMNRIIKKLATHYKEMNPNYINEYVSMIKMNEKSHIVNHTDGIINEEARPDYVMTSVTYLNEEFEGGELVLSDEHVYKPHLYSMIEFPGGVVEHAVKEITKGHRYALVAVFDYPDNYVAQ